MIAFTDPAEELGQRMVDALPVRAQPTKVVALLRSEEELERASTARYAPSAHRIAIPLDTSLRDVECLVINAPRDIGDSEDWYAALVAEASRAGVARIIYTSILHADTSPLRGAAAHLRMEAAIAATGIPSTILRLGCYASEFVRDIDRVVSTGRLPGTIGTAAFSPADVGDYAFAVITAALSEGEHENLIFELAGDRPWTMEDIAAEIAWQTYTDVEYVHLPPDGYAAELRGTGASDREIDARLDLHAAAATGALSEEGRQISPLRKLPTYSLDTAVGMRIIASDTIPRPKLRGSRPGTGDRLKRVPSDKATPRPLR